MTAVLIVACKKSPIPIPIGMSAIINNTDWLATNYYASLDTGTTGIAYIYVIGDDTTLPNSYFNNLALTIVFFQKKVGVYVINNTNNSYILCGNNSSISGTIAISQFSATNIQGTFNCIMTGGLTISNGQFNIPIQ